MHNPSPCVRQVRRVGSMVHIRGLRRCSIHRIDVSMLFSFIWSPFGSNLTLLSLLLLLLGSCLDDMHPVFSCLVFHLHLLFMFNIEGMAIYALM